MTRIPFEPRNNTEKDIFIHCYKLISIAKALLKKYLYKSLSFCILCKYIDEYQRLVLASIFEPLQPTDEYRDPFLNIILPVRLFAKNLFSFVWHLKNVDGRSNRETCVQDERST
jgi:hypothetical protein